jgi:DNA-binding response OmpR family regulator
MEVAASHGMRIDLLVADLVLPEDSGLHAATRLRAAVPHLRVLMVTGYPVENWTEEQRAAWSELPSDSVAVMSKPFVPSELLSKVESLIQRAAVRRAPAKGSKHD